MQEVRARSWEAVGRRRPKRKAEPLLQGLNKESKPIELKLGKTAGQAPTRLTYRERRDYIGV